MPGARHDNLEATVPPFHRSAVLRPPSKFELWAWSPVHAYRISLTVLYVGSTYFGVSAAVAGIPVFLITAPSWWLPWWAGGLILGSIVASFGSIKDTPKFLITELTGALLLFLTIGSYALVLLFTAYIGGDPNRAAVGSGLLVLGALPGMRLLWLISKVFYHYRITRRWGSGHATGMGH